MSRSSLVITVAHTAVSLVFARAAAGSVQPFLDMAIVILYYPAQPNMLSMVRTWVTRSPGRAAIADVMAAIKPLHAHTAAWRIIITTCPWSSVRCADACMRAFLRFQPITEILE